ncbi:MAG: hypothetical protein H6708_21245 [Kofleriaceae bacterium]|nr:hypothetical protein [Kofleriaceae bacterium]
MADPRAVAARHPDPVTRTLADLACQVTEAPWALTPGHRARAAAVGLGDAAVLHAVVLSAYFGHLNRIADAVGIDLDYQVALEPPHAEPATPPYARPAPAAWPDPAAPRALDVAQRRAPPRRWRRGAITSSSATPRRSASRAAR